MTRLRPRRANFTVPWFRINDRLTGFWSAGGDTKAMHRALTSRILIAGLLLGTLSGCGAPAPVGTASRAQGLAVRAAGAVAPPQPSLEAAFPVALALAAKTLAGRTYTTRVAGSGVDAQGRLLSDDALRQRHPGVSGAAAFTFTFTFAPDARTVADAEVVVDAAGQAFVRTTPPRDRDGWQPEPSWKPALGSASLATGLARAAAAGLPGRTFAFDLARPRILDKPGALTLTARPDARFEPAAPARLIHLRTGVVEQPLTPARQAEVRAILVEFLSLVHMALTGNENTPVRAADITRKFGLNAEQAAFVVKLFDADKDGTVLLKETIAAMTRPALMPIWETGLTQSVFWGGDADDDERLSPAEAEAAGILPAEFQDADKNADGSLTVDEAIPLTLAKTRQVLVMMPFEIASQLMRAVLTKPWTHAAP